uniref:TF-B3 domain-containing protein n=1 Tax=Kalanchoe fedtschenkoi TaxID=63787 RepID=A0A7N0T1T6_KALFE
MGVKPEFFFVFMPLINGARMRVCDAFLATLSDEVIPERVVLRNCLQEAFAVKVFKENGVVYFGVGWREFVVWNGLKLGYFLVFRYDGEGGFDVKIFNNSGCVDNGRDEAADRDEEESSDDDEEAEDESNDSAADFSDSTYSETSEASGSGTRINTKKKNNIHPKRGIQVCDLIDF